MSARRRSSREYAICTDTRGTTTPARSARTAMMTISSTAEKPWFRVFCMLVRLGCGHEGPRRRVLSAAARPLFTLGAEIFPGRPGSASARGCGGPDRLAQARAGDRLVGRVPDHAAVLEQHGLRRLVLHPGALLDQVREGALPAHVEPGRGHGRAGGQEAAVFIEGRGADRAHEGVLEEQEARRREGALEVG